MWWLFPVLPLLSALTWLGMLLGLFISYFRSGQPHYPSLEPDQRIAYISDVGAFGLKPLFIAGSSVTSIFLLASFLAERWLRHTGRLARNTSRRQAALSSVSSVFAFGGGAGLILLSIFDTYRHDRLHDGFLLLFIGGNLLAAVCLCAEYQRLGIKYREIRVLRISFWIKLVFILVEFAMAVAFAATTFTKRRNVAAVLEWLIALVFTGWVLSFALDLAPSARTGWQLPDPEREGTRAFANGVVDGGQDRHEMGARRERRFWKGLGRSRV